MALGVNWHLDQYWFESISIKLCTWNQQIFWVFICNETQFIIINMISTNHRIEASETRIFASHVMNQLNAPSRGLIPFKSTSSSGMPLYFASVGMMEMSHDLRASVGFRAWRTAMHSFAIFKTQTAWQMRSSSVALFHQGKWFLRFHGGREFALDSLVRRVFVLLPHERNLLVLRLIERREQSGRISFSTPKEPKMEPLHYIRDGKINSARWKVLGASQHPETRVKVPPKSLFRLMT